MSSNIKDESRYFTYSYDVSQRIRLNLTYRDPKFDSIDLRGAN